MSKITPCKLWDLCDDVQYHDTIGVEWRPIDHAPIHSYNRMPPSNTRMCRLESIQDPRVRSFRHINYQYITFIIGRVDVSIHSQYTITAIEIFISFLSNDRCRLRFGRIKLDDSFGPIRYSIKHTIVIDNRTTHELQWLIS